MAAPRSQEKHAWCDDQDVVRVLWEIRLDPECQISTLQADATALRKLGLGSGVLGCPVDSVP